MTIGTDVASVTGRNVPPWDQDKPQVLAAPAADFWGHIGGAEGPHSRVLVSLGNARLSFLMLSSLHKCLLFFHLSGRGSERTPAEGVKTWSGRHPCSAL